MLPDPLENSYFLRALKESQERHQDYIFRQITDPVEAIEALYVTDLLPYKPDIAIYYVHISPKLAERAGWKDGDKLTKFELQVITDSSMVTNPDGSGDIYVRGYWPPNDFETVRKSTP